MLTYYHGTIQSAAKQIIQNGIDISKGQGELGQGFYVGSSLWRAFSWAWHKSNNCHEKYEVIEFLIDESQLHKLNILYLNRSSTLARYRILKKTKQTRTWTSGHDAIWAPIVGENIKNVYQIKFESSNGRDFIQNQNKTLWK